MVVGAQRKDQCHVFGLGQLLGAYLEWAQGNLVCRPARKYLVVSVLWGSITFDANRIRAMHDARMAPGAEFIITFFLHNRRRQAARQACSTTSTAMYAGANQRLIDYVRKSVRTLLYVRGPMLSLQRAELQHRRAAEESHAPRRRSRPNMSALTASTHFVVGLRN
jgi:hypoxanthine-guanine phosphoribosyltransferase